MRKKIITLASVGILAAVAVVVIMWYLAPINVIKRAIAADDYSKAARLYDKLSDADDIEYVKYAFEEKCSITYDEYYNKRLSRTEADAFFNIAVKVIGKESVAGEYMDKVATIENDRDNLAKGIRLLGRGEYESAINMMAGISELDRVTYDKAGEELLTAYTSYSDNVIDTADLMCSEGSYNEALDCVNHAIELIPPSRGNDDYSSIISPLIELRDSISKVLEGGDIEGKYILSYDYGPAVEREFNLGMQLAINIDMHVDIDKNNIKIYPDRKSVDNAINTVGKEHEEEIRALLEENGIDSKTALFGINTLYGGDWAAFAEDYASDRIDELVNIVSFNYNYETEGDKLYIWQENSGRSCYTFNKSADKLIITGLDEVLDRAFPDADEIELHQM